VGRAPLLPHTVARSRLCLLLVCAGALAPALPALAAPSAPATTSEGMAQAPRRRDVAGAPQPLFRNLKIMVHAEVGLIGAPVLPPPPCCTGAEARARARVRASARADMA
jgi:hypothetical protein